MRARFVVVATLVAALHGCAATKNEKAPADPRPERLPQTTLDCIFIRAITDWKAVDDYHLKIFAPNKSKAYLVELTSNCHAITYANRVRFKGGGDGRLCGFRNDSILVNDQRCPIGSIKPIGEEPATEKQDNTGGPK